MFDVGFSELLLIGIVGLVVFGPERLPRLVREVSGWIHKIRTVVHSAKSEIDREFQLIELREAMEAKRLKFQEEVESMTIAPPAQGAVPPLSLEPPSKEPEKPNAET